MPTRRYADAFERYVNNRDTHIESVVDKISDRMADNVFGECQRILAEDHTAWRGHNSMSSSVRIDGTNDFDWMAHISEIKIGDQWTATIDSSSAASIRKLFNADWNPQYIYGQFAPEISAAVIHIPDDTIMDEIEDMLDGM